jgi:hypothetical protein
MYRVAGTTRHRLELVTPGVVGEHSRCRDTDNPCRRLDGQDWHGGRSPCRFDTSPCSSFLRMAPGRLSSHHQRHQDAQRQCSCSERCGNRQALPPRPYGLAVPTSHHSVQSGEQGDHRPSRKSQAVGRPSAQASACRPGNATGTLGPWRAVPTPRRAAAPRLPMCCRSDAHSSLGVTSGMSP